MNSVYGTEKPRSLSLISCWVLQAILLDKSGFKTVREQIEIKPRGGNWNDAEKKMRLRIFRDNVEFVEAFDKAGTRPYQLAINQFADWTNEEFQSSCNRYRMLSHGRTLKVAMFRYEMRLQLQLA
ncbi:unnamed protein product [Thlaspi arvense]|uniref:Cathepsin propeptide inhibitor domain-containing protein n=1 Tax=Thlaspi arvense TaxID=13288 RepID=A0AAU9RJS7_THLAR|nr:unnamed protein product [Thlaspi arvense]